MFRKVKMRIFFFFLLFFSLLRCSWGCNGIISWKVFVVGWVCLRKTQVQNGARPFFLRCASNCQLLEMLHKHLEGNIIGKDGRSNGCRAVLAARDVGGRWVELGQQETGLGSVLVTDNVTWDRETIRQQLLRVGHGCLQQLLKVLVAGLVLVSCFPPGGNRFTVEDENVEESIQKQDAVGLDGDTVQQHRLGFALKAVGHQGGLDHDQRVVDILTVQDVAVVGSLVRRVVEDLQELRATQVEHELRIDGKVL